MTLWKPGFQGTGRHGETPEQFQVRTLVNAQKYLMRLIHSERMELDAREVECWRMFGIDMLHRERVVITKDQAAGADSMWGL